MKNIVVVGAGVGGLVCSNLIAKERPDYKVILVEKQLQVGGLAQTWNRKPKVKDSKLNVTYELTHAISEMHPGGYFHDLYTALGVDWNNIGSFQQSPKFAQYLTPEGDQLEILNELETTLETLLEKSPEDKKGLKKFADFLEKLDHERNVSGLKKTLEEEIAPRFENFPQPLKFITQAALFTITKPNFVINRNKTFQNLLDNYFKDEKTKTALSMLYGYVGLPPSRVSGNLFSLMLLSYWRGGGPQAPMDNSFQVMHDELARVLNERENGEVKLNSEIEEIYFNGKEVLGVRVNPRGRHNQAYTIETEQVIIAGDPKTSLLKLLRNNLPQSYVKKMENYEMSTSLMATHILTDLPLHENVEKLGYAANILASSNKAIETENENNFPEEFVIYVNVPTVLRPDAGLVRDYRGRKIKDLHIVDMVMRSRSYEVCTALRKADKIGKYKKFKEKHMAEMIKITEEMLIPDLSKHLLHQEMYTAATYDRYGNPSEGGVYSIAPTIAGFVPNRPSPVLPLKGLYLTGSAILAGGVGGAISGAEVTAREVLKRLK